MSTRQNKILKEMKALFFQIDEEELRQRVEESDKRNPERSADDFTRGGEDSDDKEPMTGPRSEYWFEHIEQSVDENSKRSRENKLILSRLDLRTTWIMRILLAIVGTVAVTYLTTLIPV